MAIIKKDFRKRSGAKDYNLPRTSCGVVVSPNDDVIWVGDQALDYDSLNPIFEKQCGGLLSFTGRTRLPNELSLMTSKACVQTPRDTYSSEELYYNTIAHGMQFINPQITRNLNKGARVNGGKLFKFQDSGANIHHVSMVTIMGAGSTKQKTQVTIFQGSDIANPTNSYSVTLDPINPSFGGGAYIYSYNPITVDATNKVIYCTGVYERYDSTESQMNQGTMLVKMDYTTVPVDGSLTVSNPVKVDLGTYSGYGNYMESTPVFYCGSNNAGEDCFLTFTENETGVGANSTSRLPATTFVKTNKGRYYFSKYNPATNTATTIADLKGIEGFVGNVALTTDATSDHFSMHAPTHFEQSPIGGEGDIYYAYTCGFNATSGDMSILRMRWDKANDTFAIAVCSLTMNGADTIQDYITHHQVNSEYNPFFTLNTVLTKSGSDYYLSVYYTHGIDKALIVNNAPTRRNLTTFSIDATDFSALTYHSSTSFPSLVAMTQDADCTKLMSIETGSAKYWSWTVNGFVQSANESGIFHAISSDTDGRLWGVAYNASDFTTLADDPNVYLVSTNTATNLTSTGGQVFKPFNISLHLISADLPASASVSFEDSSITYAGVNLAKNLLVNAFDVNGARVQKTVQLKITGNNATFTTNAGTTLTTQTSAGADTTVGLTITGAGFINISASFTI